MYSQVFTFAVLMTVMTNVCQYFYWHRPKKRTFWAEWGPFMLLSCSTVLLLVAPLKNMVVNLCMQSFRQNGFDSTIERALDIAYMPMFGTRHQQFYTSLGYALMLWGTAMQVDLGGRLVQTFRASCSKATPKAAFKVLD